MKLVDTTIYLDNSTGAEQRSALLRRLRRTPGIIAPRFTPGRENMLQVAYNPEQTGSDALLNELTRQGIKARIVAF